MEPPHPHWADHSHSDEHLNRLFIYNTPELERPHPYWADHDHSDEQHLNRIPTYRPEAIDPPHRYWEDHSHSDDEHLISSYPTVRQLRPFVSPSPSVSPDSGYCSPSESRARTGKLRVVNTTPTPPATPPLLFAEVESRGEQAWRAGDGALSEEWSADSESSGSSVVELVSEEERKLGVKKGNVFSRGLRRARDCFGKAVRVAGRKNGPAGLGAERVSGIGGLDGKVEKGDGRCGRVGLHEERMRVKVYKRIKRTLLCKKGPVHLTPAKVRFPLD